MPNGIFNVPFPSNEPILDYGPGSPERTAVIAEYSRRYGETIEGPPFFFAAYDIINLLSQVIEKVGTDPKAIRAGLENVPKFKGLIRHFKRPVFTRQRHDALTEDDMILGRWTKGKLLEVKYDGSGPYVVQDASKKSYIDTKTLALK